jgi:serine/threonine protein kinase
MSTSNPTGKSTIWRLPRVGDMIGGQYRVERLIGLGSMGAVVEATHLAAQGRVAIKLMLPGVAGNAGNAARFVRERQAAAALRSEHAMRVLSTGSDDEALFMVMELLDGRDLDALVRDQGPLSIEDAVGYVLQACDAIAEAHVLGIIHRDLKPSNLFLCRLPDGARSVKVLDFGVSKMTALGADPEQVGLTKTDTTLGSPRYSSPEQIRDAKRVDARSDIWSLGVILHWLLTQRFPFEAKGLGDHLVKLFSEPPTPLRALLPDAPACLEASVLRCLEKPLDRRFQSVGELALALEPLAPEWARHLVPRVFARLARSAPDGARRSGPRAVRAARGCRRAPCATQDARADARMRSAKALSPGAKAAARRGC